MSLEVAWKPSFPSTPPRLPHRLTNVRTRTHSTKQVVVAPVGRAFDAVREDPALWRRLFHPDAKHPSPAGTFLATSVLLSTVQGRTDAEELRGRGAAVATWQKMNGRPDGGFGNQAGEITDEVETKLLDAAKTALQR